MADKNYNPEHMATAKATSLPISFKQSVEICNFIRNKKVNDAKKILMDVSNKKEAIPFTRFNSDVGHKKGMGSGRYPIKSSKELIKLLESAEANAQFKGLNTADLVIKHICANKAAKAWHFGRKRRRKAKRTNIEVIVQEERKNKDTKKISSKKAVENKK